MRKFLDSFSWAFLVLFAFPTFLIMMSWGSLPGDALYQVKLSMERSFAFVAPTYAVKSELYIKYTDRRFAEASKLLDEKESPDGLPYFTAQVKDTTKSILNAPDSQTQRRMAYTYIGMLSQMQTKLSLQKATFSHIEASRAQPPLVVTPVPTGYHPAGDSDQNPAYIIVNPAQQNGESAPNHTPAPDPEPKPSVTEEIDQTQTAVDDAIQELQDRFNAEPAFAPPPEASVTPTPQKKHSKPNVAKHGPSPTPTIAELQFSQNGTEAVIGPSPTPSDSIPAE